MSVCIVLASNASPATRPIPLHLSVGQPHDLISNAIGFYFVGIARLTDRELRLGGSERAIARESVHAQNGVCRGLPRHDTAGRYRRDPRRTYGHRIYSHGSHPNTMTSTSQCRDRTSWATSSRETMKR